MLGAKIACADASALLPSVNLVVALKPLLPSDTILCTDGSSMLAAVVKEIACRPVNISSGRRVIAGVYHIQNVNA